MEQATDQDIRRQLQRILESAAFADSKRLRGLLKFLVEAWLEDRTGDLKESVVGVQIFGRTADWDTTSDAIVRVQVRNLRRLLVKYYAESGGADPWLLEIPKGTYVPHCSPRELPAERNWVRRPGRRTTELTVGVLALLLVSVLGWFWWDQRGAPAEKSLSIEPFAGERGREISKDLVVLLAKHSGLRVMADGMGSPARYLLKGEVRSKGAMFQVSARIEDRLKGYVVWSETLEHSGAELGMAARELASAAALALGVPLAGGAAVSARNPEQERAEELYLQSLYERAQSRPDGAQRARADLAGCLQLNPSHLKARVALADLWIWRALTEPALARESLQEAHAELERAAAIEPAAPPVKALGAVLRYLETQDAATSERLLLEALQAEPAAARAHSAYALLLITQSRAEEALREIRAARNLDPVSFGASCERGLLLLGARRYADATAEADRLLRLEPASPGAMAVKAIGLSASGSPTESLDWFEKALAAGGRGELLLSRYGAALVLCGRRAAAQSVLAELRDKGSHTGQALLYTALGEIEAAFAQLELALRAKELQLLVLDADPHFDPLRRDPRLEGIRKRLNLPR